MNRVMIFGLGEVGTHILHFLVRDPKCPELIISDFNAEVSEKRINNALIGDAITKNFPKVTFEQGDLTNVRHTSELISKYKPDVIINCAVLRHLVLGYHVN